MDLLSWTPAAGVFWGGVAIFTWVSWVFRFRPEVVVRMTSYPNASIGDQAERWLQGRTGSF